MPDKKPTDVTDIKVGKMTDNGVIKALECYRGQKLFAFNGKKPEIYIHDILDLINRLQADKKRLMERNVILRSLVDTQKAEIERLKKLNDEGLQYDIELMKREKTAKAEAYKRFDELLKDECLSYPLGKDDITMLVDVDSYNNLLKELVGEDNA